MSSTKDVEISCRAFVKLQLHLAKYPHCAVNGLLLARQFKKENKVLEIVDVIPLFHQCLQLLPMLEIALAHVDAHCHVNDLWIAGYYEAAEHLNASTVTSLFAEKIADKILENNTGCRLVMVDNKKVATPESLCFYDKISGKWQKQAQDKIRFEAGCFETLQDLLEHRVHKDLVDFDNHLCDISLHWLNHPVNHLIVM
ncbi:ER membrane protein complex subunit 8/9 homolog [Clavelina lepadiformis]|uniref:MPN domain-containing protein n=1 Tax=Clavelina lepadiformis TaxID=159417 RepID=A0ABP0EZ14_CLALP